MGIGGGDGRSRSQTMRLFFKFSFLSCQLQQAITAFLFKFRGLFPALLIAFCQRGSRVIHTHQLPLACSCCLPSCSPTPSSWAVSLNPATIYVVGQRGTRCPPLQPLLIGCRDVPVRQRIRKSVSFPNSLTLFLLVLVLSEASS